MYSQQQNGHASNGYATPITNHQMAEEFRPQTNRPELIALASLDARAYDGVSGARYRYKLTDGRTWFAPDHVHALIQASVQPGEQFWLTRKSRGPWLVEECADAGLSPMPQPAPAATARRQQQPQPQPAAAPVPATSPAVATAAVPAPTPYQSEPAMLAGPMALCLKAAVLAAKEAQHFATSQGVQLPFSKDDVRALAITLYIEKCKGGTR